MKLNEERFFSPFNYANDVLFSLIQLNLRVLLNRRGKLVLENVTLRHTVFAAISYKGINSTPNSICSLINPNANARQFCEKIESPMEFWSQDEEFHLAEGFAMALEIFEELDKKRDKLQIERHNQMRHIVLIASQKPYEDVPIFESKRYKGQKLDNILHNLSQGKILQHSKKVQQSKKKLITNINCIILVVPDLKAETFLKIVYDYIEDENIN
ncbi:mediator of RNA polymerase II transcription subunit 25 [Brachionus plicatilis]|uniref:Mediator of RNA polymerase II transcription subunit 25 n=1 Tax=Brachionus plicatilis TaxID=10195 RepID=A0A3M7QT78_BRAPC|nr:mediator of RNA polymerase II transcription subunit 25 [Brachionus plicatilis]